MTKIISFVSQAGDQGKSLLAQALAAYCTENGLKTSVVCLDRENRSTYDWGIEREEMGIDLRINVIKADSVSDAFDKISNEDIYILDTPSRASVAIFDVFAKSDLVVMPTIPYEKGLNLTLSVVHSILSNLEKEKGSDFAIDSMKKILICINRLPVSSKTSEGNLVLDAMNYLSGYSFNNKQLNICKQVVPERIGYNNAIKQRLTILETAHPSLNNIVNNVMESILEATYV